ncbi:hypothetical protein CYMTET_14544, partial [Cymbomonas tetramitiformis]
LTYEVDAGLDGLMAISAKLGRLGLEEHRFCADDDRSQDGPVLTGCVLGWGPQVVCGEGFLTEAAIYVARTLWPHHRERQAAAQRALLDASASKPPLHCHPSELLMWLEKHCPRKRGESSAREMQESGAEPVTPPLWQTCGAVTASAVSLALLGTGVALAAHVRTVIQHLLPMTAATADLARQPVSQTDARAARELSYEELLHLDSIVQLAEEVAVAIRRGGAGGVEGSQWSSGMESTDMVLLQLEEVVGIAVHKCSPWISFPHDRQLRERWCMWMDAYSVEAQVDRGGKDKGEQGCAKSPALNNQSLTSCIDFHG